MDKAAKAQGYKSYAEALDAELRLNELAPIQHMTDVGAFMFDAAGKRYRQFSYINNMLYDDFENAISREKTKQNHLSFNDIILWTLHLLENYPDIRAAYAEQFDYILLLPETNN